MTTHGPRPMVPKWLPLYDAALFAAGLAGLPYYLLVKRPGHPGLGQRFGWYPEAIHETLIRRDRPVWIHAVSVGEVFAALPLLAALRAQYPTRRWVVSTTTPTGQRLARERLPADDAVFYVPWDLTPCVRRALAAVRPRLFLGMETELWPNLFLRLAAAGVPIAVVNGRLSASSFPRYRAVRRWLKPALARVEVWVMQTAMDAQRIVALGVDPARVHVVGNLKADCAPPTLAVDAVHRLQGQFGLSGQMAVWVAGSTHSGEEALVLSAFRQVRVDQQAVRLMLAPRHPERVEAVERAVRQAGFMPRRRSQVSGDPWDEDTVVIVDTLGELTTLYALADVVFVGGSLVPHGGHNLLEPAQLAKPIVTGPSTSNFQSIAELLREAGGLQVVDTVEALAAQVRRWLASPDQRQRVGTQALAVVTAQQGATRRTIDLLGRHVGEALAADA